MRSQGMPVGDEKHAFKLMLQTHPIFQDTVIVTQVQSASWAHTG